MTITGRINPHVAYDAEEDRGYISYAMVPINAMIQFQHGPIDNNGINGVQNEDVLELLIKRLRTLNERFPCRENSLAITKIEEALMWLEHRTKLRVEQGVEGKNLAHTS